MNFIKHYFSTMIILLYCINCLAQNNKTEAPQNKFIDITGTLGQSQGSAAVSYVNNWKVSKNKKLELGLGLRYTLYTGVKKDYITAPAKYSRSNTIPFAIVFAGQEIQNWDTLTVQRPLTHSLNLTGNIGYYFSEKLYGGINIDLIGFTIGRNTSAIFKSNGNTINENISKPSSFNLLLTGDNDLGTLNSEFFIKYKLDNLLSIKAVYQFLFNEYKTTSVFQTAPDGTVVDRFRNKVNAFGLGISYNFNSK